MIRGISLKRMTAAAVLACVIAVAGNILAATIGAGVPTSLSISPANGSLPVSTSSVNVAFTANASPAGKYEFRFRLQDPAGTWRTVQDFSTNITWTWAPPAASPAVFKVAVDGRAAGSESSGDITATTNFSIVAKLPTSVTLSRTGSSQAISATPKPVLFTANALPSGQYEYRFSVNDPVTGLSPGSFTTSSTFNWTPPPNRGGIFGIQVDVRPYGSTARPTVAVAGYTVLVPTVKVPNVVGLTQAQATAALAAAGLTKGNVTTAPSGTVPAGSVISQDPSAGTSVSKGSSVNLVVSTGPAPLIVQLDVSASTTAGTLSYKWRTTDGLITDVNAPSTTWILPSGPGIHFAYVLVSNGVGGYTEKRVVVNTDTIGNPLIIPSPLGLTAPAAPAPSGDFYRSYVSSGLSGLGDVYAPDLRVRFRNISTNVFYPPNGTVSTNLKGEFVVPGVPPGGNYSTSCSADGGTTFEDCTTAIADFQVFRVVMPPYAATDYIAGKFGNSLVSGRFTLQDGALCGTVNHFFGVEAMATATLKDILGNTVAGPIRLDELGGYAFPSATGAAESVVLQCENAVPVTVTISGRDDLGTTVLPGVAAPVVTSMQAKLKNTVIAELPSPQAPLPSDIVPRADAFLAEKGLDTRRSACQYYKAVGGVPQCDASGNYTQAISFDEWKRSVKIDQYTSPGFTTYSAAYVNKVDLNLTRRHHSVSYGPGRTAAYVCNHLGPSFNLVPKQPEVDAAIDNALNGKNLVACVAMDYLVNPGVNGDKPFTRFFIFGPSGELLPSVNLDTRREKFVPGTCVVCHGGDHYAGKFPEDGAGPADVGGHFIPYDTGNFAFSTKPGLTQSDQEKFIYFLNQNLLNAGAELPVQELLAGWYASSQTIDPNYLPVSWRGQAPEAISFYHDVLARSCRTCHVAMVEGYNFDHFQNIRPAFGGTPEAIFYRGARANLDVGITVCGGSSQILRSHSMPNSLVTFDRFWLSAGNTLGLPDQPAILTQFFAATGGVSTPTGECTPGLLP
jgi:hypothetical protein